MVNDCLPESQVLEPVILHILNPLVHKIEGSKHKRHFIHLPISNSLKTP